MVIKNVVLLGAGGRLGSHILSALQDASFNVTVLTRDSSKSTFPAGVPTTEVPDDYPHAELVKIFQGQDAVVSAVTGMVAATQSRVIDAAAEAGIQRFIPSEYGSEPSKESKVLPLFAHKAQIRSHLQSKEASGLTWTAIACGAFFEMSIQAGLLHIDVQKKEAIVLDDGDAPFPMSTWGMVGAATVAVLQQPDKTKNRLVYVQSFATTQNQLRTAMGKVAGVEIAVMERLESVKFIQEKETRFRETGSVQEVYDLIWALIVSGADWSAKLDNGRLGLLEEDFHEAVRKVLGSS